MRSLGLLFHFFFPVCCDRSQADDSCDSRQSGSGHHQRGGGDEERVLRRYVGGVGYCVVGDV